MVTLNYSKHYTKYSTLAHNTTQNENREIEKGAMLLTPALDDGNPVKEGIPWLPL
jgi:hypothetical protein